MKYVRSGRREIEGHHCWGFKIKPQRGERLAVQIMSGLLRKRIADKDLDCPVMAVRSSLDNYATFRLFRQVDVSHASVEPIFDKPLPATAGHGVAILFTDYPVVAWSHKDELPPEIDSSDHRKAELIANEIDNHYLGGP